MTPAFCKVPNYLVENLRVFSDREIALLLCIFRRDQGDGQGIRVSSECWTQWTGFNDRALAVARRGLIGMAQSSIAGCFLEVTGRGDRTVYKFDPVDFCAFLMETKGKRP
jgi:hypothetical protein